MVAPESRIRVLVVGAMHGDELSSASVALHWIQLALQTPSNAHWRFIPALNPDGLMVRPAKRVNANGVDLNRNFPTPNWRRDARSTGKSARARTHAAGPARSRCPSPNRSTCTTRWSASSPT
ncbi:murein peptide amidase A [Hydrogenophaga sp. T4]|nr:murein peptide amidase A [Hydrogenophaga sp. T4]